MQIKCFCSRSGDKYLYTWIPNANEMRIKCFCSWSENKYLLPRKTCQMHIVLGGRLPLRSRGTCIALWGTLLLGPPEWLCARAILGAKVTTSKSTVFPAKDRPTGRPVGRGLFVREFWRTLFLQSGTPSWFIELLWVFCAYTREWRWRRSWRRYHFKSVLRITWVTFKIEF